MDPRFAELVESLHPNFCALVECQPHSAGAPLPMQGVYLFSEGGKPLYVGRSRNIPRRHGHHTRSYSGINQAVFAVLIAREELDEQSDYRPGPKTRANLANNELFMEAFERAKQRIGRMEFRATSEADPVRQTLLEIYCSVVLQTPYNDFRTH